MEVLFAYDGSEYADAVIYELQRTGLPDTSFVVLRLKKTVRASS